MKKTTTMRHLPTRWLWIVLGWSAAVAIPADLEGPAEAVTVGTCLTNDSEQNDVVDDTAAVPPHQLEQSPGDETETTTTSSKDKDPSNDTVSLVARDDEDDEEGSAELWDGPVWGVVQQVDGWDDLGNPVPPHAATVEQRLLDTDTYMRWVVQADARYTKVKDRCRNLDALCAFWAAARDECDNPDEQEYMYERCAPACFRCEELHVEVKCPIDPDAPTAWKAGVAMNDDFEDDDDGGEPRTTITSTSTTQADEDENDPREDLDTMFRRIVEAYEDKVTVWSRPDLLPGDDEEECDYWFHSPWIISIDDFLTSDEVDALIAHGTRIGFEQSAGVGEVDDSTGEYEDDVGDYRTSTNAWCDEACEEDPIVATLMQELEELTGISYEFAESFQLLKYEPGQHYNTHHDYIDHQIDRAEGPRILTVFMYLNDVEEGGETRFDYFDDDVKVTPSKGRIVLWPSVLNEDPEKIDDRTEHEAMPVKAGLKYAANAWYHLRNVRQVEALGC